jgi:hypothetical protein
VDLTIRGEIAQLLGNDPGQLGLADPSHSLNRPNGRAAFAAQALDHLGEGVFAPLEVGNRIGNLHRHARGALFTLPSGRQSIELRMERFDASYHALGAGLDRRKQSSTRSIERRQ